MIFKPLLLFSLGLKFIFELFDLLAAVLQAGVIFLVSCYRTFQFSFEVIDEIMLFFQFASEFLLQILLELLMLVLQIGDD